MRKKREGGEEEEERRKEMGGMREKSIASNEAEEAGASSLFCVRTHARIGDVL